MLINRIDPYAPCYCGSGKKYRFCCQNRTFEPSGDLFPTISDDNFRKAKELFDQGHKLLNEYKYEEAITLFESSYELNPTVSSTVNNIALCHFVLGETDEALKVQREFLKKNFLLPSFGLANLSMFLLFKGEEATALNTLYIAATQKRITIDAAEKICEMFARMRKYSDLLEFVSSGPYDTSPKLAFWAGAAAANIGNETEAEEYLIDVPEEDCRISLARDYLKHLADGTRPESVRGDWPMLTVRDFYLKNHVNRNKTLSNPIFKTRWAVDYVEACINDPECRNEKKILDFLKFNTHPESGKLLRLIATGSIGSDELRQYAALLMLDRGDVESGDKIDVQQQGKQNTVLLKTINLDPEYDFGCLLPEEFAEDYEKIVLASLEDDPNWKSIAVRYREILSRCPFFFTAEFNLAVALFNAEEDSDEPERICRKLISEHPDYLFAPALLLDIYTSQERYDEADQLIKDIKMPDKTSPDALNDWWLSLFKMLLLREKFKEAKNILNALEAMPDKLPELDELKNDYKAYLSAHNFFKKNEKQKSVSPKKKRGRFSKKR